MTQSTDQSYNVKHILQKDLCMGDEDGFDNAVHAIQELIDTAVKEAVLVELKNVGAPHESYHSILYTRNSGDLISLSERINEIERSDIKGEGR